MEDYAKSCSGKRWPYELHGLKILFSSIQPMKWFSLMNPAKMDTPSFASMDDHHRANGL